MLDYRVKIGLAPCRRWLPGKRTGIFNPEYALANKKKAIAYIREHFASDQVEFIDLDFLNEEGLMYDVRQARAIADRFIAEKVDAVFIINCNYGNEEVAGKVAQLVGKPVLLWAPRDTIYEPDGTRYTDAQCGHFPISKQLQRYGLPFSHIENCNIEDAVFTRDFEKFLSVVCMVKNFKGLRIAQVGTRPKPFNCVMCNESELMERFGIEIVPVNMALSIQLFHDVMKKYAAEIPAVAADIRAKFDLGGMDDEMLTRIAAFKFFYRELLAEYDCRVVSTECWTAMMAAVNAMPCTAMSLLGDEGTIVTCESDIMGAVSMSLLSCATRGQSRPFFGEFTTRHPSDDNTELIWHCGPFPYSLRKPDGPQPKLVNARPSFIVRDGRYTIARLDSIAGKYSLLTGGFDAVEGPYTIGTYVWARFDDLPKWEKRLIDGPYIHHMAEIEGDVVPMLREFVRYYPDITLDEP